MAHRVGSQEYLRHVQNVRTMAKGWDREQLASRVLMIAGNPKDYERAEVDAILTEAAMRLRGSVDR